MPRPRPGAARPGSSAAASSGRASPPYPKRAMGLRLRLSGSYEQIREDVSWLDSCGVTEVFYDLNFDPLVGDPSVEEGKAVLRASEILEALAPYVRRGRCRAGPACLMP